MTKHFPSVLASLLLCSLFVPSATSSAQVPVGTSFLYQGQLRDGGTTATGEYDFEFKIFDDELVGLQVGLTVTLEDVDVENGLFTVELDFGPGVFTGTERCLEIGVREGASTGSFTVLAPRQKVAPTPYALRATDAGNAETLDGLDSGAFLQADGSISASGLVVEGTLDVDALVFPDGSTQTTASTSSLPTVTNPTIYTPAFLTCQNGAESNPTQWAAIALGTFQVTIDGNPLDVAVDFSNPPVSQMHEVATRIELAIRAQTGGLEVVQWDVDNFRVFSGNTSGSASISTFAAHSGGIGIDISGAGANTWTDCKNGEISGTEINLAAYSGHLVRLTSEGQLNPLFTVFPGTSIGTTELVTSCFGSGFWTGTFDPPENAHYGLVYAVGGIGTTGQLCGLSGILVDHPEAVITCNDTGNVSQFVRFTVGWGTCTGSHLTSAGTQLNGVILWYR